MTAKRLLEERKLSLLLDLDQTVVHATVDQTVGQWLENPDNPEFPALKDVHHFMLDNHPPVYYIKLRPGTVEFLEELHDRFEMHIYTMGTRSYAHAVANVIDPDKKYFKDRILSRDDSGST
jgi:RNA polymerase II subunit A-like phosphatase